MLITGCVDLLRLVCWVITEGENLFWQRASVFSCADPFSRFSHGAHGLLLALVTSQNIPPFPFPRFPLLNLGENLLGPIDLTTLIYTMIIIQSGLRLQPAGHMICDVVLLRMRILSISLIEYPWMSCLLYIYWLSPRFVTGARSRLMIESSRGANQMWESNRIALLHLSSGSADSEEDGWG